MKKSILHYVSGVGVMVLLCITIFLASRQFCLAADSGVTYFADKSFTQRIKEELSGQKTVSGKKGNIYYLSNQGNDKWKGSKSRPFRTFAHALSRLKPGDTLYVRGGTYTELIKIPAGCSGNKDNYITISNYSNERVILNGGKKKAPTLLKIKGASYLRVHGLEFTDARGEDACAIQICSGSHHLIISGNTIHDITVPDPKEKYQCANGIHLFGDDAKKSIHDVLIYQNKLSDCKTGWSECISVSGNCMNINIISNIVRNTGNIGIDICGNYGYCSDEARDFPRKCLVYKNTVSKCISPNATAYGIYVDGGQNIEIRKNKITGCSGGIEVGAEQPAKVQYATSDILIRDNILKDNIENAITIGGYRRDLGWVRRVRVINNNCRNNGVKNVIVTLTKCSGVTLSGNTFRNDKGDSAVVYSEFSSKYTKNIVFKNNIYSNGHKKNNTCFVYHGKCYTSFDKWKKVVGRDAGTYQK